MLNEALYRACFTTSSPRQGFVCPQLRIVNESLKKTKPKEPLKNPHTYQSKMGIISFRIIGEQKIPKGQTCGKNYTTFGDKI